MAPPRKSGICVASDACRLSFTRPGTSAAAAPPRARTPSSTSLAASMSWSGRKVSVHCAIGHGEDTVGARTFHYFPLGWAGATSGARAPVARYKSHAARVVVRTGTAKTNKPSLIRKAHESLRILSEKTSPVPFLPKVPMSLQLGVLPLTTVRVGWAGATSSARAPVARYKSHAARVVVRTGTAKTNIQRIRKAPPYKRKQGNNEQKPVLSLLPLVGRE